MRDNISQHGNISSPHSHSLPLLLLAPNAPFPQPRKTPRRHSSSIVVVGDLILEALSESFALPLADYHHFYKSIFQLASKVSPLYRTTYYYYHPTAVDHLPLSVPDIPLPEPTMPHAVRQVDFAPIPAYSRLPRSDELYVMKAFARHAGHCSACAHPYEVHHSGGTLCSKGHQRALDVAQYIYNKGGQSFSLVDRDGNQCVQVEIPADCEAVRSLLKAMERGLRLRRKVQPTSYDKTYHIPPRGRVPSGLVSSSSPSDYTPLREPRYIRTPSLETAEPPPRVQEHRRKKSSSHTSTSGRGSLFEDDMRERQRRYMESSHVYPKAAPRHAPPLPPKDGYWR